jgi:hypothetical protein
MNREPTRTCKDSERLGGAGLTHLSQALLTGVEVVVVAGDILVLGKGTIKKDRPAHLSDQHSDHGSVKERERGGQERKEDMWEDVVTHKYLESSTQEQPSIQNNVQPFFLASDYAKWRRNTVFGSRSQLFVLWGLAHLSGQLKAGPKTPFPLASAKG